jgi:hypothetical protein
VHFELVQTPRLRQHKRTSTKLSTAREGFGGRPRSGRLPFFSATEPRSSLNPNRPASAKRADDFGGTPKFLTVLKMSDLKHKNAPNGFYFGEFAYEIPESRSGVPFI